MKVFMSYVGLIVISWSLTIHLAFNYSNKKKDVLFWMKLTNDIPTRGEGDYHVVGLSKEEDRNFWLLEDKINFHWFKVMNFALVFCCLVRGRLV